MKKLEETGCLQKRTGRRSTVVTQIGAAVAGLAAAWGGAASPGFAGAIIYGAHLAVICMLWQRGGIRYWRLLSWSALIMPMAIMPFRILGVAVREMGPMTLHLNDVALGVAVWWSVLGVASLSRAFLSAKAHASGTCCA